MGNLLCFLDRLYLYIGRSLNVKVSSSDIADPPPAPKPWQRQRAARQGDEALPLDQHFNRGCAPALAEALLHGKSLEAVVDGFRELKLQAPLRRR